MVLCVTPAACCWWVSVVHGTSNRQHLSREICTFYANMWLDTWQWSVILEINNWKWLSKMPAILGPFESSLRGRSSNGGEGEAKMILHHSCSGASHGYGVKKEKHRLERERERRNCSLPPDINGHVPDILLDSLPASGHCGRRVMDTWTGFN